MAPLKEAKRSVSVTRSNSRQQGCRAIHGLANKLRWCKNCQYKKKCHLIAKVMESTHSDEDTTTIEKRKAPASSYSSPGFPASPVTSCPPNPVVSDGGLRGLFDIADPPVSDRVLFNNFDNLNDVFSCNNLEVLDPNSTDFESLLSDPLVCSSADSLSAPMSPLVSPTQTGFSHHTSPTSNLDLYHINYHAQTLQRRLSFCAQPMNIETSAFCAVPQRHHSTGTMFPLSHNTQAPFPVSPVSRLTPQLMSSEQSSPAPLDDICFIIPEDPQTDSQGHALSSEEQTASRKRKAAPKKISKPQSGELRCTAFWVYYDIRKRQQEESGRAESNRETREMCSREWSKMSASDKSIFEQRAADNKQTLIREQKDDTRACVTCAVRFSTVSGKEKHLKSLKHIKACENPAAVPEILTVDDAMVKAESQLVLTGAGPQMNKGNELWLLDTIPIAPSPVFGTSALRTQEFLFGGCGASFVTVGGDKASEWHWGATT